MCCVMSTPFKYWAFISYSHLDKGWADWLHRALETYRLPSRLRQAVSPAGSSRYLFPVFRDRDELPSSADLNSSISAALAASKALIVVCSPHAASSRWVDAEIRAFQGLGRSDEIFCLVVDGEPNAPPSAASRECFPPSLRARAADGREPLAADARDINLRDDAKLRLIAGILGVGFDDLRQRDRRRRRRRLVRGAAAIAASVIALPTAYVASADSGLSVPGGLAVRLWLDRYELSIMRSVHNESEIQRAATLAKDRLLEKLHHEWVTQSWLTLNPTRIAGPKFAISPWISSSAVCSSLRSLPMNDARLEAFLKAAEAPFTPQLPVEANGVKFGWLVGGSDFPLAEATLWTLAELSVALSRSDVTDPRLRQVFDQSLNYTQEVADLYYPLGSGGWNMFPRQESLEDHSTYTSALALLALLEMNQAGLAWRGDRARLRSMLRATAAWLANQFDDRATPPGWRIAPSDSGPIVDGLTLQIYSELLRAEAEAGVPIPQKILDAIPNHVDRLVGRPPDYPATAGEITRVFKNFDDAHVTRWISVRFLWHPWAIETTQRWLHRLERLGGATEAKVQSRRALGHLVVDLHPLFEEAALGTTPTYIRSETLYAVGTVLQKARSLR